MCGQFYGSWEVSAHLGGGGFRVCGIERNKIERERGGERESWRSRKQWVEVGLRVGAGVGAGVFFCVRVNREVSGSSVCG